MMPIVTIKQTKPLQVLFIFLAYIIAQFAFSQQNLDYVSVWPNAEIINQNWLYLEEDSNTVPTKGDEAYQKISLPHTWNARDVLQTKDYRRAGSWYRKYLSFSKEDLKKRIYIRFGAAGQEAKVFLNGKLLGDHVGGYSAFTFELGNDLKEGDNQLDVWVSNADNKAIAPISGDFNFYGGLYRSVQLLTSNAVAFSRNYLGSSGVKILSTDVSDKKANLSVRARVDNASGKTETIQVLAELLDSNNKVVSEGDAKIEIANGETEITIEMDDVNSPMLWSPETPNLYRLSLSLIKNKKEVIDKLHFDHGFRWFQFTPDKGFFLNGQPYNLHGLSRHQDYFEKGNALSAEDHLTDLLLMKDLGVNWLRLAHYQQDDYVLQLCDKLGILVWEEIPYVNNTPEHSDFEVNLQRMMKDLVNQHFNHPSIILWGMGNETWMGDRGDGKATNYTIVKGLNDLIHEMDPVRKTVFVNSDNDRPITYQVINIPDVFGFNIYRGWYKGDASSLTGRLNQIHKSAPNTPIILSEYGAGSDLRIHAEAPSSQDFSIEFQNEFLESHLEQIEKLEWLSGSNWWAFADFGSAKRGDSKPHVNQKGLLTFDREKKDVYYIFKSKFSNDPFVHMASPTWNSRSGDAKKNYKVISNMETVELFHNKVSLGKQNKGFNWKVTLKDGDNALLVRGKNSDGITKEDSIVVYYKEKLPKFKVVASNSEAGSKAEFAIDGDLNTSWSSKGEQHIELDFGVIRLVNGVNMIFPNGNELYNVDILGSKDGKQWDLLTSGTSSKKSKNVSFVFNTQQELQYLKIVGKGNTKNNLNNFSEISPIITFVKENKNLYEKLGEGM